MAEKVICIKCNRIYQDGDTVLKLNGLNDGCVQCKTPLVTYIERKKEADGDE